jgi:hypothetical protein
MRTLLMVRGGPKFCAGVLLPATPAEKEKEILAGGTQGYYWKITRDGTGFKVSKFQGFKVSRSQSFKVVSLAVVTQQKTLKL